MTGPTLADALTAADGVEGWLSDDQAGRLWERAAALRRPSQDALDVVEGDVTLLYVDGAHRYAPAPADLERWDRSGAHGAHHHLSLHEDLDLCLRARAQGIQTELHPDTRLRHAGAHAIQPAYGGEPHDLLARRRRAVIESTRAAARRALRRDATREAAQLRALLRPRKRDP